MLGVGGFQGVFDSLKSEAQRGFDISNPVKLLGSVKKALPQAAKNAVNREVNKIRSFAYSKIGQRLDSFDKQIVQPTVAARNQVVGGAQQVLTTAKAVANPFNVRLFLFALVFIGAAWFILQFKSVTGVGQK